MENKIIEKRRILEESLKTVNYQIANLKDFYSREQVRCWYIRRNRLAHELSGLPTEKEVRETSSKNYQFIKSLIKRK